LGEDAAQQALAKAVGQLPQLKHKDRFAGWLAAICRNVAHDMARSRAKLNVTEDLANIAAVSQPDDVQRAVRDAIADLSAPARELIFLRYYDGMSYERMAAVLGISEQAINGRLRRAKKQIADYLRRHGHIEVRP